MKRFRRWLIVQLAGKRALILADRIVVLGELDVSGTYLVIQNVVTPAHAVDVRPYGPVPSAN